MLLLDTCALLWYLAGAPLERFALRAITSAESSGELFLSPVSAWEIGILAARGRIELPVTAEDFVGQVFSRSGVQLAPLTPESAVRASFLDGFPHADPADRMLIATATLMGLRLVTRDQGILSYAKGGRLSVMEC